MKSALLTFSLAALAFAPSSHAAWQRVGSQEALPIDTASASLGGTSIVSAKGIGQPESLISDDVSASAKVNAGQSDVVVGLGGLTVVSLVSLVNEGTEGRVSIESSVDKSKWAPLGQQVFTGSDRGLSIRFAGATAKYVKLSFDLSKGGSVKSLGIFGSASDKDYEIKEAPSSSQTVNIGGGLGGGHIIYINPTPSQRDEAALRLGRFEFPESPDKYRTVIYDFGKARTLREVGSVHSPRPVRLQAYAFESELPEKEDWRGRKSFDPVVFDGMKPVALVEDARGVGYVKTKLAKSVRCRYLALRWEPDFNPPEFIVFSTTISVDGVNVSARVSGNTDANGNLIGNLDVNWGEGQNSGSWTGSAFANPFSIGTSGYGSPGRGRNDSPGTPRGPFDRFASQ